MTGICLVAGILIAGFGDDITLRWTHSIQRSVWEEDFRREGEGLRLIEARVQGTGAGMEPPAGAVLEDGVWRYRPDLQVLPQVLLRHSPYVTPYTVCGNGMCRTLPAWLPGLPEETTVALTPCPAE